MNVLLLGLVLTLNSGPSNDTLIAPNVWLYVASRQSASPFLPAGPFAAKWEGTLNIDLRGDYAFEAELNGTVKVEINGVIVLEGAAANASTARSKTVRLKKGANPIKVSYISAEQGDSYLRLNWSDKPDKPLPAEPIPSALFQPIAPPPALTVANQLHRGRELFLEFRCAKCHTVSDAAKNAPELSMDAPTFDGIGARRNYGWLAAWILDPQSQRASAHMPALFHGATAGNESVAVAAFLASLTTDEPAKPTLKPYQSAPAPATGESPLPIPDADKPLFEKLHCTACHTLPKAAAEAGKISLDSVALKFKSDKLTEFLLLPEAHYAWTRMPNFRLTPAEGKELADLILSKSPKYELTAAPTDAATLAHGRKLVTTTGCINCHSVRSVKNEFVTKPLAQLAAAKWSSGCLAEKPAADSKSPRFKFSNEDRAALAAFASTDRKSIERHVPTEFASRQVRALNCAECHGKVEGFPTIDIVGGKLRPEWTRTLLSGGLIERPRPWLSARMPALSSRAELLAHGLAQSHGLPPTTPLSKAVPADAQIGQKLTGVPGGFSCVSCHGIKALQPLQVFEAQGINLMFAGDRLQPNYYRRWMLNPLRFDPQTKMPVYFDEDGKSPLTELLDGDALKQIETIRQYLLLGEKMPLPATQ